MALDGTAAGLRASIADWMGDSNLTSYIPEFIAMAEARFNRRLRVPDMEKRATALTSGEYLALPTDFLELRSIFIEGSPDRPLTMMESGELRRLYGISSIAKPKAYALSAGQLQFGPVPDASYTLEIVYYGSLPPLATNSANWLLTNHPDVYLYGALLAAEARGWNDARLPLWKAAMDEAIAEINTAGNAKRTGAAPVQPSIRRY